MKRSIFRMGISLFLVVVLLASTFAATLNFDIDQDGKTDVWDLFKAAADDKTAALEEALGGRDELHKNANGEWEIWSELGLYNMAEQAESNDTFVLMQDINMDGKEWTPVKNFNGTLKGNLYTISNMRITDSVGGSMGFFASIGGKGYVEYLNLSGMNVMADDGAKYIGLLAGTCAGTIDGCTTVGFITDERATLSDTVYVGGMAGKMLGSGEIVSRDINKLPEEGAEQAINTISSHIGTRFVAETGHVVGIVGDGEDAVDSGTLLQDLTGKMPDPNALAWVITGDKSVFPYTVKEIIDAIDPSGNSVVTLQDDISYGQAIQLPYTCTFDCNGYTVATPADKNNGFEITRAGSENDVFTLKNGTLTHNTIGVVCKAGGVVISNMVIVAEEGAPLGIYTTDDYTAVNRVEGSTLVSKNWNVVVYNTKDTDFSKNGITFEDTKIVAAKETGAMPFGSKSDLPGTVTLGLDVDIYTYSETFTSKVPVEGVDAAQLEALGSITVLGETYTGLNHWTTNESLVSTEVMAEITNNGETIQVASVSDMVAAINPDGNTKIKLLRDVNRSSSVKIPYSCEIDLNGFTITSGAGNALQIMGVGKENTVTTVKNGKLEHASVGVLVETGSIDLSNVEIYGLGSCGASVAFGDPSGAYGEDNEISDCVMYNPKSFCITFNATDDIDFKDTGVGIQNTTLVAAKTNAFGVATSKKSGIVDLGKGVEIYCPKTEVASGALYRFLGLVAYRTEKNSVTVNGTTISNINHWSTDNQKDIIDILLIGNSYSTTIPQELYNIAKNAGYEVNVANVYYPGCIAEWHWDWLINDVANYQYRHQSEMGSYIRRGDMSTSRYALEDEQWDMIVYQDWFTPTYKKADGTTYQGTANTIEELYANNQEYAYNVMQYLKKNHPNAQHYYYQHWAWQVGHRAIKDIAAANAMWERINIGSTKFATDNDFILIPCGAAFQLARADERIGETLWDTDKSHDGGPGGGQYLAGCVFFETMFRESCIGDTWRASNGPSEAKHLLLQQHAHDAVASVHGADWVK